jgi:hypothetical protein
LPLNNFRNSIPRTLYGCHGHLRKKRQPYTLTFLYSKEDYDPKVSAILAHEHKTGSNSAKMLLMRRYSQKLNRNLNILCHYLFSSHKKYSGITGLTASINKKNSCFLNCLFCLHISYIQLKTSEHQLPDTPHSVLVPRL